MKVFILASLLPISAFAHGPVAQQAAVAVQKAVILFLSSHPEEVQNNFTSVSSVKVAEEHFDVQIVLADKKVFKYECGLDEKAKPVTWGCKAR